MQIADRLLTIVITATLVSAFWIVAGGSLIENATADSQRAATRPADAAPSPDATRTVAAGENEARPVADPVHADMAPERPDSETRNLMIPVLNIRAADLTDTFTDERGDGARLHEAIDIMAPEGTSVVAAAPGTIERLFVSDAGGNTIYVRSQNRKTVYYYAHLDEYAQGLREGQRIRRGQRLGTVGSTGNASAEAPHLHFAIMRTTADADWWEPAVSINPYPLLAAE